MAKLERMDPKDRSHLRAILAEFPLDDATLAVLEAEMPHRRGKTAADRLTRFEAGLAELRAMQRQGGMPSG